MLVKDCFTESGDFVIKDFNPYNHFHGELFNTWKTPMNTLYRNLFNYDGEPEPEFEDLEDPMFSLDVFIRENNCPHYSDIVKYYYSIITKTGLELWKPLPGNVIS